MTRKRSSAGSTPAAGTAPVVVRSLDLADPRWDVDADAAVLSEAERARAARGTPAVRRRRVLVRAALRRLLAELLDVAPADVVLRSDGGRPVPDGTGLQVSCSASADLALLTVADRAVGIDVQVHRDDEARDAVAEGWLAPAELAVIAALPARERPLAVTRAWTQKEAVLKARGTGVRRLPVDVVTPGAARGFVGALHLAPVPVPPGYVASIATGAPAVLNLPDPAPLTPGGAR